MAESRHLLIFWEMFCFISGKSFLFHVYFMFYLYTRYPIVARALGLYALGRVRRASKGILHTNVL